MSKPVCKLQENSKEIFEEVIRLLVKIADNILKNPSNLKIRILQKNNATVSNKILSAFGGADCLKYMGFKENNANFELPMNASLKQLELVKDEIKRQIYQGHACEWKSDNSLTNQQSDCNNVRENPMKNDVDGDNEPPIKKIVLPRFTSMYYNPFLKQVEWYFHEMLAYEDKTLQERAKKIIPLHNLELEAQEKLRSIQLQIKKGKMDDPELSLQDMLLLELLSWFKNDFFTWIDSPDCNSCGGATKMSHMSRDPDLLQYTDRVEMHICQTCQQLTPFPRYNDLNILIETRKGRCGEWAKVFTLFCRCLGWDSRFVVDQGDHVWTEVYSITQKRWLHCDPCENACDTPLVYEVGWGKKLSYVMAYSAEEVQDVTWRYSSNHKDVLSRRKACTEDELVKALMKLRNNRQKTLTEARRKYLTKRLLSELVELMIEKKVNESDKQGRTSGSVAWRLVRGEIEDSNDDVSYTWKINNEHIFNNTFQMRYSTSLNKYEIVSDTNAIVGAINGWHSGVFKHSGIFRKEEKDWKMVYLARKENVSVGSITWKFIVDNPNKIIDNVAINFKHAIYENGIVEIQVSGDTTNLNFNKGEEYFNSKTFSGSKSITITATLSEGKGNVAWQHAQLFRQSTDNCEYPFSVHITFKNS